MSQDGVQNDRLAALESRILEVEKALLELAGMAKVVKLIAIALAWGVWAAGDLQQLGINSPWFAFILLPALTPLWTVGKRKWSDDDA